MKRSKVTLTLLMICFSGVLMNAQSMYKYDAKTRSQNEAILTQVGNNRLNIHSAGSIFYKIVNGNTFWRFYSDESDPNSVAVGSYKKENDNIRFYDTSGNIIGFFEGYSGRFYTASGSGDTIHKEDSSAILYDGILTLNKSNPGEYDYFSVDQDLDALFIGFYLFIY